jgi:pimeloyl-ACP methyl ester carboxylesterase
LIRYACRGDVLHVVVGGRIVVRDRRLATLDLEALLTSAEAAASRVKGRPRTATDVAARNEPRWLAGVRGPSGCQHKFSPVTKTKVPIISFRLRHRYVFRGPASRGQPVIRAARYEGRTFNFFPTLSRIQYPTLVLRGEDDPMIPIECQEDIVAALSSHLVRFERFPNCGHSVVADAPDRAFTVIRDFIGSKLAM